MFAIRDCNAMTSQRVTVIGIAVQRLGMQPPVPEGRNLPLSERITWKFRTMQLAVHSQSRPNPSFLLLRF